MEAESASQPPDASPAPAEPDTQAPSPGPIKKKLQARWRQHTEAPAETAAPPGPPTDRESGGQTAARTFQPRWRRAQSPGEGGEAVHPNLQAQPASTGERPRGFQPRWRQRAQEVAAIEEQQQRQQQLEVQGKAPGREANVQAGFQPRWRRMAPEQPPPPQIEARPLEAAAEKPSGFRARWRRTAASSLSLPVEPVLEPELAVEVVEPPPIEVPPVEPQRVALAAATSPVQEDEPAEPRQDAEWDEGATSPPLAEAAPRYFLALASQPESPPDQQPPPVEVTPLEPEAPSQLEGIAEEAGEVLLLGAQASDGVEFLDISPDENPEELLAALEHKVRSPVVSLPGPDQAGPASPPAEVPVAQPPESRPFKKGLPPLPPLPPVQAPRPLPEHLKAALVDRTVPVDRLPDAAPVARPAAPPTRAPAAGPAPVRAPAAPRLQGGRTTPALVERVRKFKIPTREARISGEEVANFTRQLSVMIGSGLPLLQALHFFAEAVPGGLGKVVGGVADKVSSGYRLSVAMSAHPTLFSEVYVGLIELGETSSHIEDALDRLADLLEKQVRLSKRLSAALIYPAFLVGVSLAAVALFLIYVLPTMIPLFAGFGMELPWPTRLLLASRQAVLPGFLLVLLSAALYHYWKPRWVIARRQRANWARRIDRFFMGLPLVGKFLIQLATARVLFAMATMLDSGLPLLSALQRCELVAANLEIAGRLESAAAAIREGVTVVEAFHSHEVMPPACLHLLAAGEESAKMVEMIQYSARFYEEEVEQAISRFMSLVEPVIMVVMGLVVGFIVLSAVLPTVQMIQQLGV